MTQILDGRVVSQKIRAQVKAEIAQQGYRPCLAVVLCGNDPASRIYVTKKQEACKEVGIESKLFEFTYPETQSFLNFIQTLNNDKEIHGVLVQLPLPKNILAFSVFDRIHPLKDVDVFVPENVGLLSQGRPRFIPCTPQAIHELLMHYGIKIAGKKIVVINRSLIIGRPLSALLIHDGINGTVTTCHDQTPPELLKKVCLASDIIVVAVGIPGFLTADLVSENAVVVDVGISRVNGKVVGDVDFENVSKKTSWISCVPGGVGLTTISCLMRNTLIAYKIQKGI